MIKAANLVRGDTPSGGTAGQVLAKIDATDYNEGWITLSALLDAAISNTRGAMLYRGAAGWSVLAAGTAGQVLTSAGTGADPSFQTASAPTAPLVRVSTVQAFGNGNTNFDLLGYQSPSVYGNTQSRSIASGNALTRARRLGISSFSNGAGGGVSLVMGGQHLCGSDFTAVFVWGNADSIAATDARGFYGFTDSANRIDNQDPINLLNIVGVGSQSGDPNLSVFYNDNTGTATKTGLGSSFPANTNSADAYRLALTFTSGGTAIGYTVTNLSSGTVASGSLSTNIPAAATVLTAQLYRNLTNNVGIYPAFDFMHFSTAGDL